MKEVPLEPGLVFLGSLYVVPEFFILIKYSADLQRWSSWILILWLPLFLSAYYWKWERSLAYGFFIAVLLNIGFWGTVHFFIRAALSQALAV